MFCLPCGSVRGDSIRAGSGGWYAALVIRSGLGWIDILLKVSQNALECCRSLYTRQTKHASGRKYPISANFFVFFTLSLSWVKQVCLATEMGNRTLDYNLVFCMSLYLKRKNRCDIKTFLFYLFFLACSVFLEECVCFLFNLKLKLGNEPEWEKKKHLNISKLLSNITFSKCSQCVCGGRGRLRYFKINEPLIRKSLWY